MGQLWFGFHGYVIIRVKGARLETFVNMANREGITLRDVSRPVPDRLYCAVSAGDFRRLRPIIRALHLAMEIRRRRGLVFLANRIIKRRALVGGALLVLILLYLASSRVWFINLQAVPLHLRAEVRGLVVDAGINPGISKTVVDRRALEHKLLTSMDSLSWAAVKVKGTAVFVEVVERTAYQDRRDHPSNLIASKSGIIDSIIAFEGLPVARKGQTVRAGDVLISGVVPLTWFAADLTDESRTSEHPNPLLGQSGAWGYLFADGLVEAKTWYEATASVIYDAFSFERTGRQSTLYHVGLGGAGFRWGRKVSPFVEFETEDRMHRWRLPWNLGELSFTQLIYHELREVPVVRDQDDAKREALREVRRKIRAALPPGISIIDEQVQFTIESGRVRADILVSTVENIGANNPIQVGAPPPPNWEGFVTND